jgi:hypothetical protein
MSEVDGSPTAFEAAIETCFVSRMRADNSFCRELWSALTRIEWIHEDGRSALYSVRAAAELIARILGEGDYTDWYCCGPTGVLSDEIRGALKAKGWVPVIQAFIV